MTSNGAVVPSRRTLGVLCGAGVASFAVCAAIVADGRVSGPEAAAFHAINRWPDAVEPALWAFQLCGVLAVPMLLAVVAWALHRRQLALVLAAIVPVKLALEHLVVKQLVERQRPGLALCHLDRSCASFRNVPLTGASFPSGHAMIAWAVATVLWWELPGRWRWLPVALALLNSVARVYLGAHDPLDLVGGAGLGVAMAAGLLLVERSWRRPSGHPGSGRPSASVGRIPAGS